MLIPWEKIDTVLLDMDGTLLDLNFDNHFWQHFVPQKYAELHGLSLAAAKQILVPQFKSMEGRLEWYCLDYWSQALHLDIAGLKSEVAELIAVLPHVMEFLESIRHSGRRVLLVTNAHRNSLDLKMEKTCLSSFFDALISSHDYGFPKENPHFWGAFWQQHPFDKDSCLMIDDSLPVLRAARQFGICHLISVTKPDSQQAKREITEFPAIEDFRALMTGLKHSRL